MLNRLAKFCVLIGLLAAPVYAQTPVVIQDTTGKTMKLTTTAGGSLQVECVSGCAGSGGTSMVDNAAFTGGTSGLTPMGAIYDTTPPAVTDGSIGAPRMNSSRQLMVECSAGCSGSTFADNAAFTFGTTVVTPIAGVLDDTATNVATENSAAVARITAQKGLHVNLRNVSGTELGTASAPVRTDPTGTTTQPTRPMTITATGALAATDAAVTLAMIGYTGLGLQITGTWVGTINFECSVDGTNYAANALGFGSNSPGVVTTSTTNQILFGAPVGCLNFRARMNPYTSGTATVTMIAHESASPNGSITSAGVLAYDNAAAGVARMRGTQVGGLFSSLRDAAGNDRGANVTAGNALVVDGSATTQPVSGTVTADSELPAAAALADATANPTVPGVGSFNMCFNGTTWDRCVKASTNAGVMDANTQRVTLATDSTGVIASITTSVVPGTGATHLGKAEDAAHTTGDVGVQALTVRQDTATALAGLSGDYQPPITDATGRLWTHVGAVDGTVTVSDGAGAMNVIVDSGTLTAVTSITNAVTVTDGAGALNVICDSGCSGGTQYTHDAALTVATTVGTMAMGRASAAAPTDVTLDDDAVLPWHLRSGAAVVQPTFAGVLQSTGNGTAGTGTPRVTIASDNTAFTVNIGTFPDNEPINVAQMNGVAVTMGNGVAGTGVQRVTIASDSTGTVAATQATASSLNMRPDTSGATGAAPPARADFVGGLTSGATGGFVTGFTVADSFVNVNVSTATTTLLITGVTGRHVRISSLSLVTAAANNVALISGTGATCGTGTAGMNGGTTAASGWNFAANGGITQGSGLGTINQTVATGDSVCIVTSAATQLSGRIAYAIY
ncbi:glycoprotein repeat domain-containing protein [Caudoviricetes sp.]|nr:glycoprotein repeat domain-containing protein [Caudoviricetes sp.]